MAGSGTSPPPPPPPPPPVVPVTLIPGCVPNENTAALTLVELVIDESVIVNVAVPFKNGLCAVFPAIDPLAFVYVDPPPVGPIISCDGFGSAVTAKFKAGFAGQITHSRLDVPLVPKPQPVAVPDAPNVYDPFAATVIIWDVPPKAKPAVANGVDSVNSKSLINCPALVGFASESVSVMVRLPVPVVKVAVALTAPSPTELPTGVLNVIVEAGRIVATNKAQNPPFK